MSDDSILTVVPIYETNARDIQAMLRKAADSIDEEQAGERTESAIYIRYLEDESVDIYGWGKLNYLEAIGILQKAISALSR